MAPRIPLKQCRKIERIMQQLQLPRSDKHFARLLKRYGIEEYKYNNALYVDQVVQTAQARSELLEK